jgi:chromosomal replication initiation ATPase DnaA
MHTLPCSNAASARTGPTGRGAGAAAIAARDRIAACVARDFALAEGALLASSRGAPRAALARQVAMYLAYVAYGLDFAAVGRLFRRDRTTVSHACRVIEDLRDDRWFDRRVAALERCCRAAPDTEPGEARR